MAGRPGFAIINAIIKWQSPQTAILRRTRVSGGQAMSPATWIIISFIARGVPASLCNLERGGGSAKALRGRRAAVERASLPAPAA
jgi:hypothetical protein